MAVVELSVPAQDYLLTAAPLICHLAEIVLKAEVGNC